MADIQTVAAVLFVVGMSLLVYFERKRIKVQKIFYPLLYFVMYRTKLGLALMDRWAKRYRRLFLILGNIGIIVGFVGMLFIAVILVKNIYDVLTKPAAAAGVALVLPFRVKGAVFVPFFYWIISIFFLAVIHEFSHGVIARLYNIRIKSSGFAALGILLPILPAAFVEPDESKVAKAPKKAQLAVFAAGPFANIVAALFIVVLFMTVLHPLANAVMADKGVKIVSVSNLSPAYDAGIGTNELITAIDDDPILEVEEFKEALADKKPSGQIVVQTNISSYTLVLASNPGEPEKPYMGVSVVQESEKSPAFIKRYGMAATETVIWLLGLLYWLYVLNLGIGLFNLVPLGPIDGGRMLLTALQHFMGKDRAHAVWKHISLFFLLLIIANIAVAFVK